MILPTPLCDTVRVTPPSMEPEGETDGQGEPELFVVDEGEGSPLALAVPPFKKDKVGDKDSNGDKDVLVVLLGVVLIQEVLVAPK